MKILVLGDFHGVFPGKLKNKLKKEAFDLIIGVGDYAGIEDFRPYFRKFFRVLKEKGEYLKAEEYFGKKRYQRLLKRDYAAGRKILSELNKFGKPAIVIFGNSDWCRYPFDRKIGTRDKRRLYEKYVKSLKNIREINYGIMRYGELDIVGFGGYMEVMSNIKNEKDKKRLKKRILRMQKARKKLFSLLRKSDRTDILVLHYPPEGIFDIIRDRKNPYHGESAGVSIFREAVKKFRPRIVLCGHMHEYKGMKKLCGVPIINPGEGARGNYAIIDLEKVSIKARFK